MEKNKIITEQKPIRIAHIMGKWLGGGVEAVVMNYYKNINRDNIQFDLICDSDSTNIPYDEIIKLGGNVILIPPYQHIFKYQKKLKKILKENNYLVIHSHINTLSVFPLHVAKRAGIPVRIAHSHSTTNKKEWKKNLMKQVLRPLSKQNATDYFCCSETAGRWLFGNRAYNKGKVYVVNNAIDINKFKFDIFTRKEIREELNIKPDTLVLGHVGRLVFSKNQKFLINILQTLIRVNPNTILVLVGQGPLETELKNYVKELSLENNVLFLGQRDDVDKLYQAFDVFLFPSLYEGLGMVLIEAQCTGLKCIASTGVPQIAKITDNVEFISLDKGEEYWAEQILKNKDYVRKDHREEVIKNGYDIKEESKKLEDIYQKELKVVKL